MNIDFVVLWVDGNDSHWRKRFHDACPGATYTPERYRDWGLFKYWFRAVERYAPWVHRIFVVTDGQCPDFLNINHPKIRLVNHSDFMQAQYLPCFSSVAIELNLHRIQGLSEHFVYFNDDMFLNAPVTPETYFHQGLPCAVPMERLCQTIKSEYVIWTSLIATSIAYINKHFNRKDVVRGNRSRWYQLHKRFFFNRNAWILRNSPSFCDFKVLHVEFPYLKSVFEDAWNHEPEMLDYTSRLKVRQSFSLTIYFMMFWQFASNKFYPRGLCDDVVIDPNEFEKIKEVLCLNHIHSFCVNDNELVSIEDYVRYKPLLQELFNCKYESKSDFEL